jgi:Ca2+-binding EF-hand superfamily protein
MFDGRDANKDGKLNKEEFLLNQKEPAQAALNFVKFDKDKSGDVDRQEYVTSGK